MNAVLADFAERVCRACSSGVPLRIRGGGTKDFYGQQLTGDVLDTQHWHGIVDYDPAELVITARSGNRLADIETTLANNNQMLPFEPPHFGAGATLGGCVAAGLSGPRRATSGAVRDFVLGATLMNGRGDLLRFGGRVMKNVAGYDVSRLLAGSLGTLGLIVEVSLKVLPGPRQEATLNLALDEAGALRTMNAWATRPLPISATRWHRGWLSVRLSGASGAVQAAIARLSREHRAEPLDPMDAVARWSSVREQTDDFFRLGEMPLWRLSVPSVAAPLPVAGEQLIEWGGAQRWLRSTAEAQVIRAAVQRVGGHATLFRGGDKSSGVFQPLSTALWQVHRALKGEFDPVRVFNPGRVYDGL